VRGLDPHDAAITGMGWATSLGFGAEIVWQALLAGRSGIKAVEGPAAPEGTRLAAPAERPTLRMQVPPDQESQAKFLNSGGELAASVIAEATRASALAEGPVPPERRGLYIAQFDLSRAQCTDFRSAVLEADEGGKRPLEAERLNLASLHKVNPFVLLETLQNNAFSFLSAAFGLRGANTSLCGYEGPGLLAFVLAARAVRTGRVGAALAVGALASAAGPARAELTAMGLTSPMSQPGAAPRPFDAHRDGLVCGDAAAAVVLEPLSAARTRAPGPFAVVLGHAGATSVPPARTYAPDAETIAGVARAALREAGLRVNELLGVIAPGSGRRLEDRVLLEALRDLLQGTSVPVVATSGSLGHAGLGTEVGHVLLGALALRDGVLPPTVGFAEPEAGFEGVNVTRAAETGPGQAVLVLSLGMDGQAHAAVLARVR
jgi:3-oxoacyl-[acyl-carrier-protein] synthase II